MNQLKTGYENTSIPFKVWSFPAGERGFELLGKVSDDPSDDIVIEMYYQSSDDLVDLLNMKEVLDRKFPSKYKKLRIPYLPFGRQDRATTENSAFSLKVFAELINNLNFNEVVTYDAHNEKVTLELFKNMRCIPQDELVKACALPFFDSIVAPDKGAALKINKTQAMLNQLYGKDVPVVTATKVRDAGTGQIVETVISESEVCNLKTSALVIDDICDGGRTFIELAKVVEQLKPSIALHLYVTHGIFSQGKDKLLEYYDTITCFNDISKLNQTK